MTRDRVEIAVVGGGIVGLMTARHLALAGADVLLLDAGDIGAAASGANAGSLHLQLQYPEFVAFGEEWARTYAPTLTFLKQSIALWEALPNELDADLEFKLAGGIIVATTDDQMARIQSKARIEATAGVETEILDRGDLLKLAPYLSPATIGGGYCRMEGKANPLKIVPALANAAHNAGVRIKTGVRITGIEGRAPSFRLETSSGPVVTQRIVNAAGAEASRIGAMVGTRLDIRGVPLQMTVTEPLALIIPHLIYSAAGKLTLKQLENGGCVIGGGWTARERSNGSLVIDPTNFAGNMSMAANVAPAIAGACALRSWTAWVNGTPDWRPILGEDRNVRGVIHALFPWVGFSAAPMTALAAAELALGATPTARLQGVSVLYD
ncbi:MAG: NAD(P)/FAD-dependent oxidoreductase [Rhizobiaceae bacterium]